MCWKTWLAFVSAAIPPKNQDELNCLIWLLEAMLFKISSKCLSDGPASKTITPARFVAMEIAISMSRDASNTASTLVVGVPLNPSNRTTWMGTFGSPTFYVGDEIYFGKDQLRDVEEEILRQKARG